jgi:hypothetical protein
MLSLPSGISQQSYKYFYTICRKFWNIVQIVPFLYDGPNQNNPRRTKILRRPSTLLYVIFQKYSASCHQQQNSCSPTPQLCTFDTDSSQIDQQHQPLDHDIPFQFLIRSSSDESKGPSMPVRKKGVAERRTTPDRKAKDQGCGRC